MMFKNRSIAFKFIFFVSLSCCLTLSLVVGINYHLSRRALMSQIRENAENLALRAVNRIEASLSAIKKIPHNLAVFLEEDDLGTEKLKDLLGKLTDNNREIYGLGVAFEPYVFDPKSLYYGLYYANEKEGLKFYDFGEEKYQYFPLDWYQLAVELGRPVWSEPYFDDVLMTTYSLPLYMKNASGRALRGVVLADISLEWLTEILASVKVLKTGDAYLISRNGTVISHPVKDYIMNESVFTLAAARGDTGLRRIGKSMVRGETGFIAFVSFARNIKSWMYYTPVPSTGWSLAVVFPENELLAGIRQQAAASMILGLLGVLAMVGVIAWLSRTITRPLASMADSARLIGKGNLEVALPGESGDEVGILAGALRRMQDSLKDHIRRLTETTAAKERIESELKIAHEIQSAILPRIFPAFPDRREFDIYAMMEPAKEVGGDFYDFCLVDENRLFFVMGDVSGKGVPAALFMMITKTLLKNEALQGMPSDRILSRVNDILALDNTATMFATVFCCILDTHTGEVEFSNAGHNPPLILRRGGRFEFLKTGKSFVLGPMAGFKYTSAKLTLGPGDCLFLYTDGVTEAMDPDKKFFTEARLKEELDGLADKTLTEMIGGLRGRIRDFARGEAQSDDITMLAVRFNKEG